ncbi:MAG: GTPase HflX, partial [Nitrospirota bacterium]|nr:GTPase HflX [Nitrospirota bacterium]
LEELEDADLLLHVVDASSPRFEQHIASVEKILADLGLSDKKRMLVFNKTDRLSREEAGNLMQRFQAVPVSALHKNTFAPLLDAMEKSLFDGKLAVAGV